MSDAMREMAQQWAERSIQRDAIERRLINLRRRGLHDSVIVQLWEGGDVGLVQTAAGWTDAEIRSVNQEWR